MVRIYSMRVHDKLVLPPRIRNKYIFSLITASSETKIAGYIERYHPVGTQAHPREIRAIYGTYQILLWRSHQWGMTTKKNLVVVPHCTPPMYPSACTLLLHVVCTRGTFFRSSSQLVQMKYTENLPEEHRDTAAVVVDTGWQVLFSIDV